MSWLKKKINIPFVHWYGHSEYAILGKFCNSCEEFHFYPTYGYGELVNSKNENYMLIASSFNRYGTQFHRYFTEDFATLSKVSPTASSIVSPNILYSFSFFIK